ncbi:cbb3-type cytochrome oxidase assembly protein [Simkania negevensis]|uniref:Cbb3-type cytochrome oxidase assembly protein n=1 Tax=Simkania negevensis TaxID=83561 RepID=A0ABS3AQJ0_9BACT|nr:cbb3-type cytochrome oxidase assembly protein [Simkania negevensis]
MFWLIGVTFLSAIGGILVFLYYYKKGQFDDIEDVKYEMFRQEHEEEE